MKICIEVETELYSAITVLADIKGVSVQEYVKTILEKDKEIKNTVKVIKAEELPSGAYPINPTSMPNPIKDKLRL